MIGIVDYGMGNLRSVEKAFIACGARARFVQKNSEFEGLSGLVLPGVGAFGDCMKNLNQSGMMESLRAWLESGKPFFGICLGYQALFEGSQEAPGVKGIGFLKGEVVRFPESRLKVPQMGWNQVQVQKTVPVLNGISSGEYFYFVHSFYPKPLDAGIVAMTTEYGVPFASAVSTGNLFAAQFHPEKSQQAGLKMIRNFIGSLERKTL